MTVSYHGVTTGLAPTATGTNNIVSLSPGGVIYQDNLAPSSSSSVTIAAGDPTNPRWDMITVNSAGVSVVTQGTPAASPSQPQPTSDIVVAYVFVPAGSTVVAASQVQDVRTFSQIPLPSQSWAYSYIGTTGNVDPGVSNFAFSGNNSSSMSMYVSYTNPEGPSGGGISGLAQGFKQWIIQCQTIGPYYLRIWSRKDPTNWWLGVVNSAIDHSTYVELAVSYVRQAQSAIATSTLATDQYDSVFEFQGFVPATPVIPAGVPTGTVVPFAASAAPSGWYVCNGASKSTTTDAALFAVISYLYGGSGASFLLPDLQGRAVYGLGTNGDVNAMNDNDGQGTLANRGPTHRHAVSATVNVNISDPHHSHGTSNARSFAYDSGTYNAANFGGQFNVPIIAGAPEGQTIDSAATGISATGSLSGAQAGSGSGRLEAPSWITLQYIIKN